MLVVDDDASLRLLCRINLELDGYEVIEAVSATAARAVLAGGGVDAVLLDLHLGNDDGRDLLHDLGDDRPPVALFTGSEQVSAELSALAEAVLAKPFELDALAATVERLVAHGATGQVDSAG